MSEEDRNRLSNAVELALENGADADQILAEVEYVIGNFGEAA